MMDIDIPLNKKQFSNWNNYKYLLMCLKVSLMICNTEKKLKKQFRIDKSQPSSIGWARFLNIKTWDRSSFDRKRFINEKIDKLSGTLSKCTIGFLLFACVTWFDINDVWQESTASSPFFHCSTNWSNDLIKDTPKIFVRIVDYSSIIVLSNTLN